MEQPPPHAFLSPLDAPHPPTEPQSNYQSFMGRMIPMGNLPALSGYYFAIFGLIPIVGVILGPLALIFGLIGMSRALQQPQARGMGHAIFSVATGTLVTILNWSVAVIFLLLWIFVPQVFHPPPPAQ